jgi:hypothetical protein
MIRVTRAMLRSYPSSTLSTFKKIHKQNLETQKYLEQLQQAIRDGANTSQIYFSIEDRLRQFLDIEIDWPS